MIRFEYLYDGKDGCLVATNKAYQMARNAGWLLAAAPAACAACGMHQYSAAAHPYAGEVDGLRPPTCLENAMTQSSWIKRCIAAVCCACGMAAASAETVTLTFDHIAELGPYPDSWTESGFIITSLYADGPHLHAGSDELWLHSREGSSPYRIQRVDGGSFDFVGFDYAGGDSIFVSNGGASFTILGDQPMAPFAMSASFQHVTYIDWFMPNPGDLSTPQEQWGTIDNIVMNVSPVPEPAQVAMLGLGLAGLLLRGRRARRG
jgi:hypothetical protein